MSIPTTGQPRAAAQIPADATCASCGQALSEPFGWCSSCREAYCIACGRHHFCTVTCEQHGCHAGLCVRLVSGGRLSADWGLPPGS